MTLLESANTDQDSEIFLEQSNFFAPTQYGVLDQLFGRYDFRRKQIEQVAELFKGDVSGVVSFFIEGNRCIDNSRYSSFSAEKIFEKDGAIAALNAAYWQEALGLTDIYQSMPQNRKNEWDNMIREMKTPDFDRESVVETLKDLLASRELFVAEKIDGIFRALSGEHVTNSPAAFGKRMIIARLINSFGSTDSSRIGFITDLRAVIAKFMGREEPAWHTTSRIVDFARRSKYRGQWVSLDGGTLRLRAYKCGTAHLEVHPDMAWRLNSMLAHLYPQAIPAKFRSKPARKAKEFVMMQRPLPYKVVEILSNMTAASEFYEQGYRKCSRRIDNTLWYQYAPEDKHLLKAVEQVLAAIGGTKVSSEYFYRFTYDPTSTIEYITLMGCIPDDVAHQFYPTPEELVAAAGDALDLQPGMTVLEPSAGQGALCEGLPKDQVQCIEISPLRCEILRAKGYATHEADFLAWAPTAAKVDRVLMNPPFSEGRWQAHLQAAAELLNPGGRLVAILPASAKGKDVLPGMECSWSRVWENQFEGTSTSVVILSASR